MYTSKTIHKITKIILQKWIRTEAKLIEFLSNFLLLHVQGTLFCYFGKKNSMKRGNMGESKCVGAGRCGVLDLMVKIPSIKDHYRDEDIATLQVSSIRSRSRIYHVPLKQKETKKQRSKEQIFHLHGYKNALLQILFRYHAG